MRRTRGAKKNLAGRWFALAAIVCAGHALPAASEEVDARIRHKPVETAWSGVRIELAASIRDVAGVDVARVYFKAEGGANFLFVPMRAAGGNGYAAILPAPSAGVGAIEYRILARNLGGMVYKTQAYAVAVEDGAATVASDREPLKVFTELAELPDTIHGFTDNIALDVVESAAKYGVVAGLTGEAGAGTAAASVSATGGSTVAASAGLSTVATVGIGAAAAAAVGGVVVAIQEDENRAPEFPAGTLSLDVEEGTEGDIGAPVTATDPDGDALTYSLGGADAGLFEIDAAGQLSARHGLDVGTYTFDVVATDPGGLAASRAIVVTVSSKFIGDFDIFVDGEDLRIEVCVRDNAEEDGDMLTVKLNGEAVFTQVLIINPWDCRDGLSVNPGSNIIEVYAHNTGSRGTNTGEIRVTGINAGTKSWRLDEDETGIANINILLDDGQPASESDWRALVALYNSTDGANWHLNENWSPSLDATPTARELATWYGVNMSHGRVAGLEQRSNNLNGALPPELGDLTGLRELILPDNQLTGSLPVELGDLAHLNLLDLSGNQLTGSLPLELTALSSLDSFRWHGQRVVAPEVPLCAPSDQGFQDWLAKIPRKSGLNCDDFSSSGMAHQSAPRITDVALTSDPGPDGVYTVGEVVEATVRFDQPVSVVGVPRLTLGIGSRTASAQYTTVAKEAAVLIFRYTVAKGDHDADGVSIGVKALQLNDSSIVGADGSAATNLSEHMIANAEGHIVDARVQRAERAILEDALAAQGRAHLASATGVIGDRFRAGPASSPRMTDGRGDNALPNRYDPMDVQALAAGGRGSPFESGAAPGGVAMSGEYGAAQPFQPTGTGPGRGMGSASLGSVFGRNFAIPLGGEDDSSSSGWTLWGANDVQTFRGTSANGSYDGDLRSLYLGIDGRIGGDWLAGVALSRSRGETAYGFEVGDLDGEGMLRANLTSIHPYLHGRLSSGLEVWGIAGFGGGEAVLRRDDPVPEEAADLAMGLGALGVRQGLREFGSLKLSLLADAGVARLATDAGAGERTMDGLSALVTRFRVGIEGEHLLTLAGGGSLRPFWQASGRYDGGDGLTGQGMELAAGVRYGSDRWDADIQARWLAVHSSASHEEFGASASLRIKPNASGLGLTAALSPQWGASSGGAKSMWREEILRVSHKVDAQRRQRDPWSMDGRLEYGVALPYTLGVLKPFGEFRLAGETSVRQRLGLRLDRSVGDRSLFGAEFGAALVEHPLKKGSTVAIDLTVEARF